ncbi:hypothetical protein CH370_05470 [Leptospira kmetyi]|nr:hypothetical protein CH370_05470 [Leptospira kmetyi]
MLYFLNILKLDRRITILVSILTTVVCVFVCGRTSDKIPVEDRFPGRAWAKPVVVGESLPGIGGLTAKDCGQCHEDHYREWKTSTHANAFNDLQFQSELTKPNSPQWLCLNCHIPLSGQRKEIATHLSEGDVFKPVLVSNPKFNANWEKEGVSCGTCHLKSDSNGNTILVGPTGANAPHPVTKDKEALHSRCNDCHNQEYKLNSSLVCYFKTGEEFKESLHYGKEDCVSCHMPSLNRKIVPNSFPNGPRDSHRHTFIGGGVPKTFELFEPQWNGDYKAGLEIGEPTWSEKDFTNRSIRVRLELENKFAGHSVPTGDPERHVLVEAILLNEAGREISKETIRIGQTWEWYPEAKLVADNRIRSGEKRKIDLSLHWKEKENVRFGFIRIKHVRLTKENAEHMRKNSKLASKEIGSKLERIESFYPFANLFYESKTDLNTKKTSVSSRETLFKISKQGSL